MFSKVKQVLMSPVFQSQSLTLNCIKRRYSEGTVVSIQRQTLHVICCGKERKRYLRCLRQNLDTGTLPLEEKVRRLWLVWLKIDYGEESEGWPQNNKRPAATGDKYWQAKICLIAFPLEMLLTLKMKTF